MEKIEKSGCPSASGCSTAGADGSGCASCSSRPSHDPMVLQDQAIAEALTHVRHVIFVMSGKGGVGKSSVTVNTAAALAHQGYKVGVLDIDLHGPSVANLFGLSSGLEMDEAGEKLLPAPYSENLTVISMDSLLRDKDTAIIWRGPKKNSAIRQFLSDVAWGELDYLVVDSPPGTGDEHMTLLKAIPNALCLMVTTPQEISLADVRKAINFLRVTQSKILGVVENMSGLTCPHCGNDIPLFKKGGGKLMAEHYKVPFLGAVPLDPVTVVAADRGVPVVDLDEPSQAKDAFLNVAQEVVKVADSSGYVVLSLPENGM